MPAPRLPKTEVDAFLGGLRAVTGCVARHVLSADANPYAPALPHSVTFGRTGVAAPLRDRATGGPSGLLFDVRLQYRIEDTGRTLHPAWLVTTTAYEYRLLDRDERELLVFHWQPGPEFAGPDHPHLHVSASLRARVSAMAERNIALDKLHVPTGYISLATVVRMLVDEFGIKPLRDDWRQRLDRVESAFRRRGAPFDWPIGRL